MKKIISFTLAILLLFALSACKGDEKNTSSGGGDEFARYACEGKIPELNVSLNTPIDEVHALYPDDNENADENEVMLNVIEGETAVGLVTLAASYYYEKANIDFGVSLISITGGSAFGLSIGDNVGKNDVISKLGEDYSVENASEGRMFILPVPIEGCEILSKSYGAFRLDFFFSENSLIAVTLTDTEHWSD